MLSDGGHTTEAWLYYKSFWHTITSKQYAVKSLQKLSKGHKCKYLVHCNLKIICAAPHHHVSIYEVSA